MARYQAALTARVFGSDVEVPDVAQVIPMLDDYLLSESTVLSVEQVAEAEWRQVMGLGGER